MADRSVLGWDTVAEYETDPIASNSDDGKKIRQAEHRVLTKRKTKTSNKLTLRVFSQQFRIDGENNGFTPPSQRNFNLRFPLSNFTQDSYYRLGPSRSNVRSVDTCFSCSEREHWRKYCPNSDTESKGEGMKIDKEFSDLSNGYTIQEFGFEKGKNYPSVKGRLKKNSIFWRETLSANSAILEIIDNGYKIPVFKTSECASFRNFISP